jgi:hypothetical protein
MKLKPILILIGVAASLAMISSTLAANININSGPVEFGQGISQTTACDGDGITVTPRSSFIASGEGYFKFTSIELADISTDCVGKDFLVSAFPDTSTALALDALGSTIARIKFVGVGTTEVGSGPVGDGVFNGSIESATATGFHLVLSSSATRATQVYKLTLESADTICSGPTDGTSSSRPGSSAFQIKQSYPCSEDGIYWIANQNINGGTPFKIYADMTRNGGGWTLIVANSVNQWTYAQAQSVNAGNPPTDLYNLSAQGGKYSILSYADYIKKSASGFQYRIEAETLGESGGIWTSNQEYSFVSNSNSNTDITLNQKFGTWEYAGAGIEARMPYLVDSPQALITTSSDPSDQWWGTLVQADTWNNAVVPWIWMGVDEPSYVWYWVR